MLNRMRKYLASVIHHPSLIILLAVACAGSETRTIIHDDLSRPLSLPPHVGRIVTLAPNLTEIVFAIGAGEKIAGTDEFSDFPPQARRLPKVGGMQPNIERIVALRPDLVFATTNGNHPSLAPALASAGIPLFVVRTDRLSQIPAAMTRLGEVLDAPRAVDVARAVRSAIAGSHRKRNRTPRVLFAVWPDPLYVAGRNTFSDDLISLTGAGNVVQQAGWPQYSLELLVADPPDIILFPDKSVSRQQAERLLDRVPETRSRIALVAVDENRFTRPGPRVAEAAKELNAILDRWESQPSRSILRRP